MKKTRKFMTAITAITMVSALTPMTAFADTIIKNKSTTELDPVPSSAGMDVKYTYADQLAPSYTVTIPAGVELNETTPTNRYITAEVRNMEDTGKKIVVTLDGASNDNDSDTTFHAKNGDSDATYSISTDTKDVKIGSTVAEFTEDGSSTLTFSKINLPENPVVGDYSETLTFGIALENILPEFNYNTFNSINSNEVLSKNGVTFISSSKVSGNLYGGGSHTFSVEEGKKLKSIEFITTATDASSSNFSSGSVSISDFDFYSTQDGRNVNGKKVIWTGDAQSVTFTGYAYAVEYVKFVVE